MTTNKINTHGTLTIKNNPLRDKPQHTPTPWRTYANITKRNNIEHFTAVVPNYSGSVKVIAQTNIQEGMSDKEQIANAEFIVTSCNNHYSMLSLLKQCLKEGVSNDTKTKIEEMLRTCEKN